MKKPVPFVAQLFLVVVFLLAHQPSFSQGRSNSSKKEIPQAALEHIKKNKQALNLTDDDFADLELSSETESKHNGIKHLYIKQLYQGIEIHGAITNISMTKEGKVVNMGNRFHKEVGKKVKTNKTGLSASEAVAAAASHLKTSIKEPLSVKEKGNEKKQEVTFSTGGISLEPITAKLIYQPMGDGSLRLAWEVSIYELDGQNWWLIRVDANNGSVLDKDNLVVHCEFDNNGPEGSFLHTNHKHTFEAASAKHELELPIPYASNQQVTDAGVGQYNVFAMPVESPSHGSRSMVSGRAADPAASADGWHKAGTTTYTITRGNNVYAYEDPDNTGYVGRSQDMYGYSPDGGSSLLFDFPIDFTQQPVAYRDAAITNLFYWSNITHDVWYKYGFDEQSGNFQTENYDKGGLGGDHVMAEAQDSRNISSTRNNANFATPIDGNRPRMQMYLWNGKPDPSSFTILSPASIAGEFIAGFASFGPQLTTTPLPGKLVMAIDGVSPEGCSAFTNVDEIRGNIAVVVRGGCTFTQKVKNAQNAGAIAVVIINTAPNPAGMSGADATITIPALMIGSQVGTSVRAALAAGEEVNVHLKNNSGPEVDGDFDNGIIVHEYGHGISMRLTGGPDVTNCLPTTVTIDGVTTTTEQMGEGWSDYFGLMMTMKATDTREMSRGIGTYVQHQPTTGTGIRPTAYSTDRSISPFTYGITNNPGLSAPHGVGYVWATMLWDMTWDLIDQYGYHEDLYDNNAKAGNIIAMQLVIDGLKLQPCRPGFADGRDAILLADRLNNGGVNQELIWRAFAKRGLGFSARQNSNVNRFDNFEAFDMPPVFACSAPEITVTPSSTVFTGGDAKTIFLGYGPQSVRLTASGDPTFKYTWSPATGLSSTTVANPVFKPRTAGTYTFTVTAVNADECTRTASVTITVVDVRCGSRNERVMVCHEGMNSLCLYPNAIADHLSHGDVLGSCDTPFSNATEGLNIKAMPNPFSNSTTLEFVMEEEGSYMLEIRNRDGILMTVLAKGSSKAGEVHTVEFNRGNLPDGMYYGRLVTDKDSRFVRIMLMR